LEINGVARQAAAATLRSVSWLPNFDDSFANAAVMARWAAARGGRGLAWVVLGDKLRWPKPVRRVADPWITLAAIATVTEGLRLETKGTFQCQR
jgi:alkanesulfonate monooxygenase SsuD/methylene tetrahydromethanopterin reductase-like flavin-dependent oxidoreductase (luciferase family)